MQSKGGRLRIILGRGLDAWQRERSFVSVGGGVAVLAIFPLVEVETRVGLRFGARRRGVIAGLVRLGWNFHYREQAPMPQLGVVLGVALL